jgi:hypothetical protein
MIASNKVALICFLATFSLSIECNAQGNREDLPSIYKEYRKTNSLESKKDFFYAFPNSFSSFQRMYGYDDHKGSAPLYSISREHISLFFKTADMVDDKIFSQKLLDISKNGKWDADAVNYFQESLRKYFFTHNKSILELLSKNKKDDIYRFWYFFSDGPHFNKEVYSKVIVLLSENQSMKEAYLRAVQQVKKDNIH